jgi:uncharacterized lipoprotein YehR (DUF1307 family)
MKYFFSKQAGKCILLSVLFAGLMISNLQAQTKEQIEKALNDAYEKFKNLKE